jgi:putative peptidoglycan lipid II flippase
MSSAIGDHDTRARHVQERLTPALRRVVFLVVPSAIAFIMIGGSIVALLFQSGRFSADDTTTVWIILAGSAVGLSAGTQGRLLGSAFYALGNPTPPLHAALVRVGITGVAGYAFALPIRDWLGYAPTWGAFGLTASAGFAAWVEFLLLRRWLEQRIGRVPIPGKLGLGALIVAVVAGAAGYGSAWVANELGVIAAVSATIAIVVFGAVYLGIMVAAGVPEARGLVRRLRR